MSETSETSRIETFCDGVFAIAITLLILEIKIPPLSSIQSENQLQKALLENWPSWFGFLLSFAIIFISWVNHHSAFKLIRKASPQFIYANGFMLLTVVVLPFATGLMSEFLNTAYPQTAVSIYCFVLLLHNISWILWGWTAIHPHSLARDESAEKMLRTYMVKSPRFAFFIYLGICILSFWFPFVAMLLITATWVGWIITSLLPTSKK